MSSASLDIKLAKEKYKKSRQQKGVETVTQKPTTKTHRGLLNHIAVVLSIMKRDILLKFGDRDMKNESIKRQEYIDFMEAHFKQ